jgi:predicted GNAT family acetyltransferase
MDNIKETPHYFYIGETFDTKKAYIKYTLSDDVLIIESTKVDPSLRGQGIAAILVEYAVMFARKNNYNLKATCSYARKQLKNNPDYNDVYSKP